MNRATFLPLLVFLVGACGGSSPGSGTGTLFVAALAKGEPDKTRVEVEVKASGVEVEGASVVVKNVETGATETIEDRGNGEYRRDLPGYVRRLGLTVTRGADQLEAELEGPTAHVIIAPANNAIVRRSDGDTLRIEWEADGAAEAVTLALERIDRITLDRDPGAHEVPIGGLENGAQDVEVTRRNAIELAGGVAGSRFEITYTVDNRFTIE